MIKEPKYTVINKTTIGDNKTIAYCKNLINEIKCNSLNSKEPANDNSKTTLKKQDSNKDNTKEFVYN